MHDVLSAVKPCAANLTARITSCIKYLININLRYCSTCVALKFYSPNERKVASLARFNTIY